MTLRAPFPYFGGKRRAASLVWEAIGNVDHYVEPFCGSAAVPGPYADPVRSCVTTRRGSAHRARRSRRSGGGCTPGSRRG